MITKFHITDFIVPRVGTATLGTSVPKINAAGNPNLAVGAFGVFTASSAAGSSIPETPVANGSITLANTPYIQFTQRRDLSRDAAPVPYLQYWESGEIKANQYCGPITAVKAIARTGQNQAWVVGDAAGTIGAVEILDEAEYVINASQRGWKSDLMNGFNNPIRYGRFTTPDYFSSTLYTTDAQRRDHILQNLAYDFNNQSADAYFDFALALCFDSTASASTAGTNVLTLAQLQALNVGDSFIYGFDNYGAPQTLTVDAKLIATFNAITGIPTTAQLIPFALPSSANLAVATRIVAGGRVAGTPTSTVDHLMLLPLDVAPAYYDEEKTKSVSLLVGLESGFNLSTRKLEDVQPDTGFGYGFELRTMFNDYAGNRRYVGTLKDWQGYNTPLGNEVDSASIYDLYTIEYCYQRMATSGMPSTSPRRVVIGLVNQTTPGYNNFTGTVNPHVAYLEGILNAWLPLANSSLLTI